MTMLNCKFKRLALVVGLIFFVGIFGEAFAQGGSAGGTIPKREKTISGGDPQQEKGTTVSGGNDEDTPGEAPQAGRRRTQPSAHPLNGKWLVKQDCKTGQYEIELTIQHSSPTEFSGTSLGVTTGQRSKIVAGRIEGKRVTFTRQAGALSDRWSAQLKGSSRFSGTSKGPAWRCTYTASRK